MLTEVRERPILFSGPMVKAILAGRKTQTRRVIFKDRQPEHHMPWRVSGTHWQDGDDPLRCPYGQAGDRLWCRESWRHYYRDYDSGCFAEKPDRACQHLIDYAATPLGPALTYAGKSIPWRPSIHMPRWASRITLEITGVKVERLQEIGEVDACLEGVPSCEGSHVASFAGLWDHLNLKGGLGWDSNPWVWVVSFKRLEATC